MKHRLLILLAAFSLSANPQPWSAFLDASRAIDWTGAGFEIPDYTRACTTQPTLKPDDPAAAAENTTAIQTALASCDDTHNVVNIPAGTYYTNGWTYSWKTNTNGLQGKQVVRGAGPMATTIYLINRKSIDLFGSDHQYAGTPSVLPPAGTRQCRWTAGFAQGTSTITLSSCGAAPPVNRMLVLDQANDASDSGGVYICDAQTSGAACAYNPSGNVNGRLINGVTRSQKQIVMTTGVTSDGGGTYTVIISPAVLFTNIRRHSEYAGSDNEWPGAWWPGTAENYGLENVTLHLLNGGTYGVRIHNCHRCWVKNIRALYTHRAAVLLALSLNAVIRDSYFYGAQSSGSSSYVVEVGSASGSLIENNIFQQVTVPLMFGQGSGNVVGYNFSIMNNLAGTALSGGCYSHNAGSEMNLWEGNNLPKITADSGFWGSSTQGTLFRNVLAGWAKGIAYSTYPIDLNAKSRAMNLVGNVLGQPGYHNTYDSYATSTTQGVNGYPTVNKSIFALGWTGVSGVGGCKGPPVCDPLVRPTLMRWGNYDVVTNDTKWDFTEASPAAAPFVDANFTQAYFSSLARVLPASLYYSSKPSWWPATKAWPAVGPDVSSGNLGVCSGTYAGAQATASSQCTGGDWSSAWATRAHSIPAQDCYLDVMHGSPEGTGNVLSFDASLCYSSYRTKPAPPTELVVTKAQ